MTLDEFTELKAIVAKLSPSNAHAFVSFTLECALTGLGIWLSTSSNVAVWLGGQLVLSLAIWHWFVILHSCGHHTYFRQPWLNDLAGLWASLFCGIPYFPWRSVHAKHHQWTGWKDKDPTTRGTLGRKPLTRAQRTFIDFCWRFWIPIFGVIFTAQTFWNVPRVNREISRLPRQKVRNWFSVLLIVGAWVTATITLGFAQLAHVALLALALMLVFSDPILLSQHVHLPLRVSNGQRVRAFSTLAQDEYSRSIEFPRLLARVLFLEFNSHSVHHVFPRFRTT